MDAVDPFDRVAFLGLARRARRDPYRLSLFAKLLAQDERPFALLPVVGGDLLVTDRRLLELRPHLDVHGAWNVKEFLGYEVRREFLRGDVKGMTRVTKPVEGRTLEDTLVLHLPDRETRIVVSRGPEVVLSDDDVRILREAFLPHQAK